MQVSMKQAGLRRESEATFHDWTDGRELTSLGTNAGARELPFQHWRKVKEAFAPELVERAVHQSDIPVHRCIDPFGGSGTTGIACQFLGIHPVVAEVNPYLADLTEAKLSSYASPETLSRDLKGLVGAVEAGDPPPGMKQRAAQLPRTFVEPGYKGRWLFDRGVVERVFTLHDAIEGLPDPSHQRLFRVLLGGILVELSNVTVSGKGRRYRRRWQDRRVPPTRVSEMFRESALRAIDDIHRFGKRTTMSYEVIKGDSRLDINDIAPCELAVFSPPYPNSFDYTDIYNVELWMLGYLSDADANAKLRSETLSSHVQVSREFPSAPTGSPTLARALTDLDSRAPDLWDARIPAMIGAYFSDLLDVLGHLRRVLVDHASAWVVVGDSRYAGVQIPVAVVLQELTEARGWRLLAREAFRSMRTSAQQGGERGLGEYLLVLQKMES